MWSPDTDMNTYIYAFSLRSSYSLFNHIKERTLHLLKFIILEYVSMLFSLLLYLRQFCKHLTTSLPFSHGVEQRIVPLCINTWKHQNCFHLQTSYQFQSLLITTTRSDWQAGLMFAREVILKAGSLIYRMEILLVAISQMVRSARCPGR